MQTITPEQALSSHRWAVLVNRQDGITFVHTLATSEGEARAAADRLSVICGMDEAVDVARVEWNGVREVEELPQLIDVNKAAEILDCSVEFVRRLCRERKLRAKRMGKVWRVNTASLLDYAGLSEK